MVSTKQSSMLLAASLALLSDYPEGERRSIPCNWNKKKKKSVAEYRKIKLAKDLKRKQRQIKQRRKANPRSIKKGRI